MPAEIITGGASVVPWSLVQASVRRFKCPNKASTQRRTRSPSRRPHFRGVSGGRAAGTRCAPERPPLIAGMLFVSVGLGKTRSAFWLRLIDQPCVGADCHYYQLFVKLRLHQSFHHIVLFNFFTEIPSALNFRCPGQQRRCLCTKY